MQKFLGGETEGSQLVADYEHIDRIQKRIEQVKEGSYGSDDFFSSYRTLDREKEMNKAGVEADVALGSLAASYDAQARFGDTGIQKEESDASRNAAMMLNPDRNKRNIVDTPFGSQDAGLNPLFIQSEILSFLYK